MDDRLEVNTTPDFEAVRQKHHATNIARLVEQETSLQARNVPVAYWTYIICNANDSIQPPQGAICYDRKCAIDLMTPTADVRVLWRSRPTFDVHVVDGRDLTLVRSLVQDASDRELVDHCKLMVC